MYSRIPSGTEDVLTLAASGWTYDRTFVLYDYETESIWYHLQINQGMKCIAGQYEGRDLEELSGFKLRWSTWKDLHPDTKYMCYGDICAKNKK